MNHRHGPGPNSLRAAETALRLAALHPELMHVQAWGSVTSRRSRSKKRVKVTSHLHEKPVAEKSMLAVAIYL